MSLRIATALVLTFFALGAVLGTLDSARVAPFAILATLFCGFGLGALYWHPYRGLGLSFLMLLAATGAAATAWVNGHWSETTLIIAAGTLAAASGAFLMGVVAEMVVRPVLYWAVTLFWMAALGSGNLMQPGVEWIAVVCGSLSFFAFVAFFRPTFELACEPVLWLMFRVRLAGPGADQLPRRGPCIVIANHACWFDPLFLAKVLPRPITPMMGSQFYDLPVLRPLARHLFHVIRVPEDLYKKQGTPEEIVEAIAALDRGECLVVFPEGFLRRSEEKLLKRFGRGIWQILAARPDTPVFCCWIEGAWGSYTSYFNGPPTKNKKRDFRRAISLAVPPPITVDRTTLENHLSTRIFLMNRVLESRGLLGLPEEPRIELPKSENAQD
jgi:1-acyl-sn-glycerol-3-phosphate acyltransferase